MIDANKLDLLRCYPTSSWAIWSDRGNSTADLFYQNTDKLKNNVVFLGLNPSGKDRQAFGNFQNFRKPGHRGDALLKKLITNEALPNLSGAYMTDLSEAFGSNSREVKVDVIASGHKFEEQLAILNGDPFTVICFGEKAFKSLTSFYDAETYRRGGMNFAKVDKRFTLNIFHVYHYSLNGFNDKNALEKLPEQLLTINRFQTNI